MKKVFSQCWMCAVCVLLLVPSRANGEPQKPYSTLVTFGTSLSDSGNAFALTNTVATPPDYSLDALLIPSAPYARGGHHLTNGATWVEDLAKSLKLTANAHPAFRSSSPGAMNFAVGGARAVDDGVNMNLNLQVSAFLQQVGGVAPSDGLYVIEMGSNDVRDALAAIAAGGDGGAVLMAALASIAHQVQILYAAGARNFLIWNVANVGQTPAARILDVQFPGSAQLATQLTLMFNAGLATTFVQLSAALPGIHIVPFDAFGLFNDVATHPTAYGLTNVVSACLTPNVPPFSCADPDEFLFWDGVHPTEAVHAIIAEEAGLALSQ